MYARAVEALNRNDWAGAWNLAERLLRQAPSHAGVHFVAGVAALQMQRLPAALPLLQGAVRLNPGRADYKAQWARALAAVRQLREATEVADEASAMVIDDPFTLDTLGVIYTQANAHQKAAGMFRRAVGLRPDVASFRFNLATSLTFSGDTASAASEYEACIACDPRYWKAHLALAQLAKQHEDRNHVARLRELLARAGDDSTARMYLSLALAKELEDLGGLAESFEHLKAGKAAGRATRGYSFARDEDLFAALHEATSTRGSDRGHDSEEPIFVIGMPRTGTTLVDRILSSHPLVSSAGELPNFGTVLKRLSGSSTSALLDRDTAMRSRDLDWARAGATYIASTRPITGHSPRFVDKLPHNFLYAGFIAAALPNARIVCLRRNPMDTCLSNFRQLFTLASPYYDYSFDLLDTGRYYLLFDQLMTHWRNILPGRVLEVDYEGLVDAQEGATRRLLEFCGLPWDAACLRFERNEAPVSTASAVQVREPLYRSAVGRWKRYEAQLSGLRDLLEAGGVPIR